MALTIIWYANELISRANTTIVIPTWQIGTPRHGWTVRAFARTIRLLPRPPGFPCRSARGCTTTTMWRSIVANQTGQSGFTTGQSNVMSDRPVALVE
jgi:hypothetical protein